MKEFIYILGWLFTAFSVIFVLYAVAWLFHKLRKARKAAGKEPFYVFRPMGALNDEEIYIWGEDERGAERCCTTFSSTGTFNYFVNNTAMYEKFKPVSEFHTHKVRMQISEG
jgi:hypothetical protein